LGQEQTAHIKQPEVVRLPFARAEGEAERANRIGPTRRRVWMFRLLLLVLLAVGQEALFRLEFPFPEVHGFNRLAYQMMAQSHGDLSRLLARGLVYDRLLVESRADGFSEVHSLNRYGFRGPDFAIRPSPGRRRILLVGDSVTEGMGASDSTTIARALERQLVQEGETAEVINLGVISATLDHLTILARDAITLLHPADVVVILYANDLPAREYNLVYDGPGPAFPPWKETWWLPRTLTLLGRIVRDEPFYRRWPHLPIRFFAPVPDRTNPWTGVTVPPAGLDPELYQQMRQGTLNPWLRSQALEMPAQLAHDFAHGGSPDRHLMRMAGACRAVGARLVIAYVPFCGVVSPVYAAPLVRLGMAPELARHLPLDPIYRRPNLLLARVCAQLNLPLADTTDDLAAADAAETRQYWEYDTHPRPAGYATIARRIGQALMGRHQ
jgi:lysophospholipase L1-like esterase